MPCIFEGCEEPGRHILGVRLRRPEDLTAVWAPNTNALICDHHAGRGMRIVIELESLDNRVIETTVQSVAVRTARRTTDITQLP